ncbi:Hypothetical protein, putative [Bodo saltans]|uniref:Uncharacterized protein n=1 Tax=Bodo saltans TaxID=75058 RepID=A0A0S4JGQ3_BODSA|nr:Hypothetical protein, putative [Bodo saltans]|eukprot:CUG90662.1 Hypothetical protein, putative [Bodo saltans]
MDRGRRTSTATTATSRSDAAARRRLTIQRADTVELFDTTPYRIENKFPLLHARTRDLDDLLLQEIYLLMFRSCEVSVTPFSQWVAIPQLVSLFHVSSIPSPSAALLLAGGGGGGSPGSSTSTAHHSHVNGSSSSAATVPITPSTSPTTKTNVTSSFSTTHNHQHKSDGPLLVGGMLYAEGEFLFGEMPFVRNRVKDVRCRLEFDSMDSQVGGLMTSNSSTSGLAWLATVPQPPKPPAKSVNHSGVPNFEDESGATVISIDGPTLDGQQQQPSSSSSASPASTGGGISIAVPNASSKRGSVENPLNISPNREALITSPTITLPLLMPTVLPPDNQAHRSSISGNTSIGGYPAGAGKYIAGGVRLPPNVNLSSNGIATCRVHFRVEEFECGAMSWIVQRFQLIEPNNNVTYGPVFARAFQPADASSLANNSSASAGHHGTSRVRKIQGGMPLPPVGSSSGVSEGSPQQSTLDGGGSVLMDGNTSTTSILSESTFAASQFGVGMDEMHRAKRKALPGEERLRVLKPALYQWCLDRNPTEMGAGATIIKELLLYFRHTFSVVRTIRSLMLSVRRIQTACRRMLERRRNATVRMLTEWTKLELEVQGQLNSYVPVSNDPVDAAVYEALKANIITSDEFKSAVMTQMYNARQVERLALPPEKRGDELLASRYRFFIPAQDLLAESHRRLVERLCRTADSPIFKDARIRDILRDRTDEILLTKARKERDEQKRKDAARNKGTFGTASRTTGGAFTQRHTITNKFQSPPAKVPTSPSRGSTSSRLSGTGGVMNFVPSPPPALQQQGRKASVSFSMRSGGGEGTFSFVSTTSPRKKNRNGGRGGRSGPRPQHLRVLDAMFDDV